MGNFWSIFSSMGCQLPNGWIWLHPKTKILDTNKVENYSTLKYDQNIWDTEIVSSELGTANGGYNSKNSGGLFSISYLNEAIPTAIHVPVIHDVQNSKNYQYIDGDDDDDDDFILYQSGSPKDSVPKEIKTPVEDKETENCDNLQVF